MPRVPLIAALAVLLTAPAAQARDPLTRMPRKADEPRRTGCERYGPGFVKVEGTDTCVRLSGDVRVEADVGRGGAGFAPGVR